MKEKPYKAKSITGAQARVRLLQKLVNKQSCLLDEFDRERKALAKLAADSPQFFNPLDVLAAKNIRDRILERMA